MSNAIPILGTQGDGEHILVGEVLVHRANGGPGVRGNPGHGGGIETAFRDDGAHGRKHVLHPPFGEFLLGDASHGRVGRCEAALGL
jgi:hypothetical protein